MKMLTKVALVVVLPLVVLAGCEKYSKSYRPPPPEQEAAPKPPQVIAFISDLHLSLGDNWPLEDFRSDCQVGALINYLHKNYSQNSVDLVLLGDIFDLWQVVPASDLTARKAGEISVDLNIKQLGEELGRIATKHPTFFEALARFSQNPNNRLVILAGNHDHALVSPELQIALRKLLVEKFQFSNRENSLVFPKHHSYASPQLGVYAEHGNQYDNLNCYENFFRFGSQASSEGLCLGRDECKGYGLVRLIWNRLENLDDDIDDTPEVWTGYFAYIRRHARLENLAKAVQWWHQYNSDPRVNRVTGRTDPFEPEILLNGLDLNPGVFFSQDPDIEKVYKGLYHSDKEFQEVVDEIREKKFSPGVPPVVPKAPAFDLDLEKKLARKSAAAAVSDPVLDCLTLMFQKGHGPDLYRDENDQHTHLNPRIYNLVIMGHTHKPLRKKISGWPGKLYFNTGTWTTRTAYKKTQDKKKKLVSTKTERTVVMVGEDKTQVWVECGIIQDSGEFKLRSPREFLSTSQVNREPSRPSCSLLTLVN